MTYIYLITPFLTWFFTGVIKFVHNSFKSGSIATSLIGYGGFPSNHSAIVSSMTFVIYLEDGLNSPALGVALTIAFIVILDAASLRRQVGRHAQAINLLSGNGGILRERIGHTFVEIIGGIAVGMGVAYIEHVTLI